MSQILSRECVALQVYRSLCVNHSFNVPFCAKELGGGGGDKLMGASKKFSNANLNNILVRITRLYVIPLSIRFAWKIARDHIFPSVGIQATLPNVTQKFSIWILPIKKCFSNVQSGRNFFRSPQRRVAPNGALDVKISKIEMEINSQKKQTLQKFY